MRHRGLSALPQAHRRIPVAVVLGGLAEGLTPEAILHEYPALTAEAIRACVAYAAETQPLS
ncbi:MAG: DUF433 domain-containing protein [Armatimonadetes bacterium]|nr:DUF433 domain-containing protein [Armatimonadota bacterium]